MLDDKTQLLFPSSGIVELPLMFEPQLTRCLAFGPAGRLLTVLLDTGTDPSAIDLRLAQQLDLRLGDFGFGHGAASDGVPFTETILPWLRLGDLTIRDLFMLAVDLSTAPFKIDIVLGYNVLRHIVFHVEYTGFILRLSHPDLGIPAVSTSGALLPFTFFEHFPALTNVLVCNTFSLPLVTIDTGSNGGLTLSPDLAAALETQPGTPADSPVQGAGFFSGKFEVQRGYIETLSFGPFTFHNVELETVHANAGDLHRPGRANIGNRLLSRFATLTLDYERQLCAFEPLSQNTTTT